MNADITTAHRIRRAFIEFFRERGHTEAPSAPLVPRGDPTLLFTSAGMVQFKEYYLQPENLPYSRATSVQKCLRAGDLENIGRTVRHHTFFEMLGNFSFGDYFKREAIRWAWEFVTDLLDLPVDRLSVSVFEDDDEAETIWLEETGIPRERIVRLGRDDNFWGPVGPTGVCGPCSEIYFDTGPARGCGRVECAPGCDCDRYLEFWNLVFPQFFLEENGTYRPLEKPGIDTGLGLERLAMIMQGVEDNFHTDLFEPIIDALAARLPERTAIGKEERMALNMVADHARALTFTIAEGVYPSNEGRGYLLRRLLRRAITRFYSFGVAEPFLYEIVATVTAVMAEDYPELVERENDVAMIVRAEEESFFRTLEEGRGRFAAIVEEIGSGGSGKIDGERAFLLYDTYGLPIELTRAMAAERGLGVDEEGFERAMEEQRRRAQEGSAFSGGGAQQVTMTEVSEGESSIFVGYERMEGEAAVRRFRLVEKSSRPDVDWENESGPAAEVVIDRTPFYATSGGQAADRGSIDVDGRPFVVRDVFKRGGEIVHLVEPPAGADAGAELAAAAAVAVKIDDERRMDTARNHTATHLLHAALREIVGRHVKQAGSLVDDERLRFDFNHFQAVGHGERRRIEERVNELVREAIDVRTELMDYRRAIETGATALFDEKYGDSVRVVRIGDVSVELCGGTHVSNTGKIGAFLVVAESSVAAGVRRIEALTGRAAIAHAREAIERGEEIGLLLKVGPGEAARRIESLIAEIDEMRRRVRRLESGEVGGELDRLIGGGRLVAGVLAVAGRIPVDGIPALRNQADVFRGRVDSGVAVLSAPVKEKMQFVVAVTDDLPGRGLAADRLVRELGPVAGGGGGGRGHLAQLGTKDMDSEAKIYDALPAVIERLLT
ncbi:MAG: alanine--tRNA ligase [Candidatus Krumholzibacteriota bacterium]|nr:alanine--tRNA ligase [Candidatus Krumholzibacteriota bacterium]